MSLVVREQNTHFYKCSLWLRGRHTESFLSGHRATGCHCADAAEWTARRPRPSLERSCLSCCPISHVSSTAFRCCYGLLCILLLNQPCYNTDLEESCISLPGSLPASENNTVCAQFSSRQKTYQRIPGLISFFPPSAQVSPALKSVSCAACARVQAWWEDHSYCLKRDFWAIRGSLRE